MNTTVRIAVAAAVVIAAALVGVSYITGRDDGADPTTGQGPASTPSPTAAMAESEMLEPGRYSVPILGTSEIRADVTVEGEEWTYDPHSDGSGCSPDPRKLRPAMCGSGCGPSGVCTPIPAPRTKSCPTCQPTTRRLTWSTALDAQVGSELSAPTDVVVDGYPAVRANLTVTCDLGDLWTSPNGLHRYSGAGSSVLWIVDVGGTTVVIDAQSGSGRRGDRGDGRQHDVHNSLSAVSTRQKAS